MASATHGLLHGPTGMASANSKPTHKSTGAKIGLLVLESQREKLLLNILVKVKKDLKVASSTEKIFLNQQIIKVHSEPSSSENK